MARRTTPKTAAKKKAPAAMTYTQRKAALTVPLTELAGESRSRNETPRFMSEVLRGNDRKYDKVRVYDAQVVIARALKVSVAKAFGAGARTRPRHRDV